VSAGGWSWLLRRVDDGEPCCTDITRGMCFSCRHEVQRRLYTLCANLAIGAALCAAFDAGSKLLGCGHRCDWCDQRVAELEANPDPTQPWRPASSRVS
jgi:hypothetical protein